MNSRDSMCYWIYHCNRGIVLYAVSILKQCPTQQYYKLIAKHKCSLYFSPSCVLGVGRSNSLIAAWVSELYLSLPLFCTGAIRSSPPSGLVYA